MKKIQFVNNSEPYLSAENLNQMQSNIEEAIEEKQTYSTEEIIIGKWVDGKLLYRRVLEGVTEASANITLTYIQDLDALIDIRGVTGAGYKGGMSWVNLGVTPQEYRQVYVNGNMLGIVQAKPEAISYKIILEYTKTTD